MPFFGLHFVVYAFLINGKCPSLHVKRLVCWPTRLSTSSTTMSPVAHVPDFPTLACFIQTTKIYYVVLISSVNFGKRVFKMELSVLLLHQDGPTQEVFFLKRSKEQQENKTFRILHSQASHHMPKYTLNLAKFAVLRLLEIKKVCIAPGHSIYWIRSGRYWSSTSWYRKRDWRHVPSRPVSIPTVQLPSFKHMQSSELGKQLLNLFIDINQSFLWFPNSRVYDGWARESSDRNGSVS